LPSTRPPLRKSVPRFGGPSREAETSILRSRATWLWVYDRIGRFRPSPGHNRLWRRCCPLGSKPF
jgi:hypothetical protein